MQAHIEKEYKMMIDEKTYNYYLNNLDLKTHIQINYYYLTSDNNKALRIRQIDNKYFFTMKIKELDYHKEYEFEIENNSLDNQKIQELLKEFNINNPKYIGQMKTTRSIHNYEYGEFCLDKSEYQGITDYELEFELYDYKIDNHDEFTKILDMQNLTYSKSPYTKFKRFLLTKK